MSGAWIGTLSRALYAVLAVKGNLIAETLRNPLPGKAWVVMETALGSLSGFAAIASAVWVTAAGRSSPSAKGLQNP
jgi:hypothetical protein